MAYRSSHSGLFFGFRAALVGLALGVSVACGGQQATPESSATAPSESESPGAVPPSDGKRAERASIFAVHEMMNFDEFIKFFDTGAPDRAKAGVKGYLLTRLEDGRVVIHLFADDVATVDAALKSPEMLEYISRRGAPETSLVWLTRDVVVKLPPAPPKGETYSLYLKLKVGDFAELETGFRALEAVFTEQAVIAEGLHRATLNEDMAILHFVGTDKHKLEDLPKRKEFIELLKVAKSEGELKPLIGVDVARERPK